MSAQAPHPQQPLGIDRLGLPRALVMVVVLGCLVLLLAGVKNAGAILAPAFFAFNLVLTARPLQRWLLSKGWPRPLVVATVMVVLYAVLVAVFGLLGIALVRTANELPRYASQFLVMFDSFIAWLDGRGVSQTELLQQLQANLDFGRIISLTQALLGFVSSFSTQLGFIVVMLFFLVIDLGDDRARIRLLLSARPDFGRALQGFSANVRRYWVVSTVFGFIVAVIDYIGLVVIGVPLAFTWGILAFVTNYIPNVGFLLGLIPPTLVALLEGGVQDMIWVIVLYTVANTVLQTFVQPKFTSDALGINTTMNFLSLAFWSYLLGPLGALIAVPATMFVKAVLIDADPGARWLNVFIDSEDSVVKGLKDPDDPSSAQAPDPPDGSTAPDDQNPTTPVDEESVPEPDAGSPRV